MLFTPFPWQITELKSSISGCFFRHSVNYVVNRCCVTVTGKTVRRLPVAMQVTLLQLEILVVEITVIVLNSNL